MFCIGVQKQGLLWAVREIVLLTLGGVLLHMLLVQNPALSHTACWQCQAPLGIGHLPNLDLFGRIRVCSSALRGFPEYLSKFVGDSKP